MKRRFALLVAFAAAALAVGCKQNQDRPASPYAPLASIEPPPTMPAVDPFAHPAPWQPDPFAFTQSAPAYRPPREPTVSGERNLAPPKDLTDNPAARDRLQKRVFAGQATQQEVGWLVSVCKAQHDNACGGPFQPPKLPQ